VLARRRAASREGVVLGPAPPGATFGVSDYLPGERQCVVLVAQLAPARRAPLSEDHRPSRLPRVDEIARFARADQTTRDEIVNAPGHAPRVVEQRAR
jgi:hypothetical protein